MEVRPCKEEAEIEDVYCSLFLESFLRPADDVYCEFCGVPNALFSLYFPVICVNRAGNTH